MNRCLIDRRPYFFKHRYEESKKEYDRYVKNRESICLIKFDMDVQQLRELENKTDEQIKWLDNYDDFCPLVESDSAMNLICKYMEGIDAEVKASVKGRAKFNPWIYIDQTIQDWQSYEKDIAKCYKRFLRQKVTNGVNKSVDTDLQAIKELLEQALRFVCSDPFIVANCLVHHLMVQRGVSDLDLLWDIYGKYLVANAKKKSQGMIMFPFPEENGSIKYLGKTYELKEVLMNE